MLVVLMFITVGFFQLVSTLYIEQGYFCKLGCKLYSLSLKKLQPIATQRLGMIQTGNISHLLQY